jgi:hypothetical protein
MPFLTGLAEDFTRSIRHVGTISRHGLVCSKLRSEAKAAWETALAAIGLR